MKLHAGRGVKFGGLSALSFAVITPFNNLLRDEPVLLETIAIGSVFVFCVFAVIGMLTDKFGSEIGDV